MKKKINPATKAKGHLAARNSLVELSVEKLSLGGDGIARKDGLVYFVPLSAPGDKLSVEVTESKKNFARGLIKGILEKSTERVTPRCQYFQKCGGCNWQHLDYIQQTKWKEVILKEQLKRLALPEMKTALARVTTMIVGIGTTFSGGRISCGRPNSNSIANITR